MGLIATVVKAGLVVEVSLCLRIDTIAKEGGGMNVGASIGTEASTGTAVVSIEAGAD